jgi:hypothetical protein
MEVRRGHNGGTVESENLGKQLVFAIAQQSFEVNGIAFSTLKPIMTVAGEKLEEHEFPNRGLVWWMVKGLDLQTAPPGRLLVATLEHAQMSAAQPDKDAYQAAVSTVRLAGPRAVIEIVDLGESPKEPLAILSMKRDMDHHPTQLVLVRLGDNLIGPLKTEVSPAVGQPGRYRVGFTKQVPDKPIYRIPSSRLKSLVTHADVSLEAHIVSRSSSVARCRYELLPWSDFDAAAETAERLDLVTTEDLVRRAARQILTRSRTNELVSVLREVQAGLQSSDPLGDLQRLTGMIDDHELQDAALDELLHAVARSHALAPRLQAEVEVAVAEAVQQRSSAIRVQAEADLLQVRRDLSAARSELQALTADLEIGRRNAQAELDAELANQRRVMIEGLETEASQLHARIEQLRRDQSIVESSMASAVARLKDGREEALTQFLVLQPIMEALGAGVGAPAGGGGPAPASPPVETPLRMAPITLPQAQAQAPAAREALDEGDFVQRLIDHAEACGFRYARRDLIAYHVATKVSDLSILGGVSGTGKSSLPRLYSQALAGDDAPGADRFLPVDVSPAWTSPADLLGYVNLLDHSFTPGACGLFTRLAEAALEYKLKGPASGLYLVCLDEMNLAHVEHYFSAFIQALSRDPADRVVRVFDENAVAADDPSRLWASLPLRPNVRFTGTINFDETTRRVSRRVLDRADLLELRPSGWIDTDRPPSTSSSAARGRSVTVRDIQAWTTVKHLSAAAAQLFSAIQSPLTALGCPLTPRRQTAIATFLASAEGLCDATEALDMQLAHRVLPQISGIFRPGARQAIEALDAAIAANAPGAEVAREMVARILATDGLETLDDWAAGA